MEVDGEGGNESESESALQQSSNLEERSGL